VEGAQGRWGGVYRGEWATTLVFPYRWLLTISVFSGDESAFSL